MAEPDINDYREEIRKLHMVIHRAIGDIGFATDEAVVTRLQDAIKVDFHCHVCGAETSIAPNLPDRAVCPEHCPDHMYEYERGEQKHYCGNCGQEPPLDWYSED